MTNSRQRQADRRQFAPSCRRQDESAGQSLGQRRTERSPNPSCANYGQLVGSCRLYGVPVVVTSDAELARVRRTHQLRAYRIGSVLRIGVVLFMVAAMLVGTPRREWGAQTALICVYAFAALWALALAFRRSRPMVSLDRFANIARYEPLAFTAVDVLALTGFQLLSTDGIYSLLIMTLLPVLVALDISSRRAAAGIDAGWIRPGVGSGSGGDSDEWLARGDLSVRALRIPLCHRIDGGPQRRTARPFGSDVERDT